MILCQLQARRATREGAGSEDQRTLDGCVTVATSAEERYLTLAYEGALRQQAARARYPDLLLGPLAGNAAPVYSRHRPVSRLFTRVVQHDTLHPEQLRQLSEFRFHQYVLWHWYDTRTIISHQIQSDPALAELPGNTLHSFTGTADGQILAYCSFQPAKERADHGGRLRRIVQAYAPSRPRVGQLDRPLFPAEWESFGPEVLASLPALQQAPISDIREMNCLLRNATVPFARTAIPVVEMAYTICQVLLLTQLHLRALVGCINQYARNVHAKLGMPMLYAPFAPVVANNLPYYWSAGMNDSGKFWPFAVSVDDFRAHPEHLSHLDAILSLAPREIGQALGKFRRSGARIVPEAIRPQVSKLPYFWTDDAVYAPPGLAGNSFNVVSPEREEVMTISRPTLQPLKVTGVTHAAHSD